MIRLVVDAYETFSPAEKGILVAYVEAETMLEALHKLHEQLNAVGMPRQFESTASSVFTRLPAVSC